MRERDPWFAALAGVVPGWLIAFLIPLAFVTVGVYWTRRGDEHAGGLALLGAILLWVVDIIAVIWR